MPKIATSRTHWYARIYSLIMDGGFDILLEFRTIDLFNLRGRSSNITLKECVNNENYEIVFCIFFKNEIVFMIHTLYSRVRSLNARKSRSFENSYIPENPRTLKPLTFSKNRLRGAKNRSILSPVAKKNFRKNNFFFQKLCIWAKKFFLPICTSLYNTYLKGFEDQIHPSVSVVSLLHYLLHIAMAIAIYHHHKSIKNLRDKNQVGSDQGNTTTITTSSSWAPFFVLSASVAITITRHRHHRQTDHRCNTSTIRFEAPPFAVILHMNNHFPTTCSHMKIVTARRIDLKVNCEMCFKFWL
ncbi:hypothetical protein LXL04_024653 [Taraxacum kok-saghyz]